MSAGHGAKQSALGAALQKYIFGFDPFNLNSFIVWIEGWGISRALILWILYLGLLSVMSDLVPDLPTFIFSWLLSTAPVWAPVALSVGAWKAWVWYVQAHFIFRTEDPILLEMRVPREVFKSPRAMELFLSNLWIRSSETTFLDKYWSGGSRPDFSFELVSLGGEVHFYIWAPQRRYKNLIEANLYAHYPEVELVEVEDYALKFHYDAAKYECFATDYQLEALKDIPDHVNAFPIKTYVDFELDKDPKEEFKIDPIAQVVEVLGAMNKDEQAWVQIIIRSHLKDTWKKEIEKAVESIRISAATPPGEEKATEDELRHSFPHPTWRQQEQIKTMERNMSKLPFEFGIRGLYIAPRGKMRSPEYTAVRWIFRPFGNPNYLVHIRPRRWHNTLDYPWQDYRGIRSELMTKRQLDAMRRRSAFHSPWPLPYNITSTEVLATIWHPPSRAVSSPALQRIPAKKAEPPPNLPK